MWEISYRYADKNRFKFVEKRWPQAYASCFLNLRKLFDFLEEGGSPLRFKVGFFRSEKKGVYRIGQTRTAKTREMRLYIYPDESHKILYVLTIGTKNDQHDDIGYCHHIVKEIESRRPHEPEDAPTGNPS